MRFWKILTGFLVVAGVCIDAGGTGQLSEPTDGGGPSIESSVRSSPALILDSSGEDSWQNQNTSDLQTLVSFFRFYYFLLGFTGFY